MEIVWKTQDGAKNAQRRSITAYGEKSTKQFVCKVGKKRSQCRSYIRFVGRGKEVKLDSLANLRQRKEFSGSQGW